MMVENWRKNAQKIWVKILKMSNYKNLFNKFDKFEIEINPNRKKWARSLIEQKERQFSDGL